MPRTGTVTKPSRRSRGRRVAICLTLLIGVLAVCWRLYTRFSDPEYVRRSAENYLQQFVNGPVEIGSASFSWGGGIRLFDVEVREVERAHRHGEKNPPVFSCREVELSYDSPSLLLGKLKIESITAMIPKCVLVRETAGGPTNLTRLIRPFEGRGVDERITLPAIELQDAVSPGREPERPVRSLLDVCDVRPGRAIGHVERGPGLPVELADPARDLYFLVLVRTT